MTVEVCPACDIAGCFHIRSREAEAFAEMRSSLAPNPPPRGETYQIDASEYVCEFEPVPGQEISPAPVASIPFTMVGVDCINNESVDAILFVRADSDQVIIEDNGWALYFTPENARLLALALNGFADRADASKENGV